MHRPSNFRAILLNVPLTPLVIMSVLAVGCSSDATSPGEAAPDPVVTSSASPTPTTQQPAVPTSQGTAAPPTSSVAQTPADGTVEPVRPISDPPATVVDYVPTSIYLSRVNMSSSSIEMTWSDFEGAVDYRLHRLPRTSDDKPDVAELTADNEIHVAVDSGRMVDESVVGGTTYWYGMRAFDADGVLLAHGWHRADAVDDVTPPSSVEIVSATVVDGEVHVSWIEPEENYRLHAYRVLRSVGDAELETVAVTWNLDQMTLIDDDPPSGTVTYAVVAMDFHWNKSSPLGVEVEVS